MVTQINLGGFTTGTNGQSVATDPAGIGLDTQSLITQLTAVASQPATNDQTQITANGNVSSALTQFQSLLSTFQSAADALSNPPGVGNQANNVFDFTNATVGNGGSSYLSVTAQPGAALQTYNISNISSLATAASQVTGTFSVASANASVVSANPISGSRYQFAPGAITLAKNFTASQFTTGAQGSNTITATLDSVANLQVGDSITVSGASGTLDGITAGEINGTQTITSIDTANNTVTYATSGTATAGNQTSTEGGNATAIGPSQSITLNEGDSLNTVANDFNAVSDTTGITATVVQISSGQFQLSFNATDTGSANSFDLSNATTVTSDPSGVLSNIGLTEQQSTGVFTISSPTVEVASSSPLVGTGFQFTPGMYSVNGQTVTIGEGDTLAQVANDFNSVSGTGITAHIVQNGTNQYQLTFTQNPGSGTFNLAPTITGVNIGVSSATTIQQITGVFTIANPSTEVASSSPLVGTGFQFTPGVYSINGHNVTITEGDTLADVEQDFNSAYPGSGVIASVVNAGSSGYQLTLTQTSGGGNFNLSSLITGVGLAANSVGAPPISGTDASFDLNGIPITRSSNNISDVINDLTFSLLGTTPNGATVYPVTVSPDTTTVQNAIVAFVNAYNAIQTFATQQTQLTSTGTYSSSAILANNLTFRQTMSDISQQINGQVAGLSGSITSLAGVGITLTTQPATSTTPQVNNVLTVNDGALSSALTANFKQVENVFGFNMASDNPNLTLFSETNALNATSFTLNIAPGTSTFTATVGSNPPITLTATALPNNGGYTLTGPAGSALAGLVLIYASTSNATINVSSITNGIASTLFNTSNAATIANTGTLAVALQGIQTQNTSLQSDITQVNARVALYKAQLTKQYAALEGALANTNVLLDSIAANEQAQLTQAQLG